MKAAFTLPLASDYGPGSAEVRQLLSFYRDIDFFAPTDEPGFETAASLFRAHNELARARMPERFAPTLDFRFVQGDWRTFVELCQACSTRPGYEDLRKRYGNSNVAEADTDWKYGATKQLIRDFKNQHQWSEASHAALHSEFFSSDKRVWANLWLMLENNVPIWLPAGTLPRSDATDAEEHEWAGWYYSFASMDVQFAVEWQLAAPNLALDKNPFWPLVQIYATGVAPFYFSSNNVTLFALSRS